MAAEGAPAKLRAIESFIRICLNKDAVCEKGNTLSDFWIVLDSCPTGIYKPLTNPIVVPIIKLADENPLFVEKNETKKPINAALIKVEISISPNVLRMIIKLK